MRGNAITSWFNYFVPFGSATVYQPTNKRYKIIKQKRRSKMRYSKVQRVVTVGLVIAMTTLLICGLSPSAASAQETHVQKGQMSTLKPRPQSPVDYNVYIEPGIISVDNNAMVEFAGDTYSFESYPVSATGQKRIDLLTLTSAGALSRVAGTEAVAASAVAPSYPEDELVIAEISITETAGNVAIAYSDIKDVRFFLSLGDSGISTATENAYVNVDGDTMTGALNLAANGLVAGTDQLVLAGGKIGIGVTNPSTNLHIYQGTPSADQTLFQVGTSDDATRFYIDEDGDVGLDGTLAAANLNATTQIQVNGSQIDLDDIAAGSTNVHLTTTLKSNYDTAYGWGDHSTQNYLDLDTYTNADTDSTDDFVASNTLTGLVQSTATGTSYITGGDVGIGIASPAANLNIKGTLATALTGTVSVTATETGVTGSSTAFDTELAVGDSIKIGSEIFTVSAIGSATSLTLDTAHSAGASAVTAYKDSNLLLVQNGDSVSKLTLDKSGTLTATAFSGDGSNLSGVGGGLWDEGTGSNIYYSDGNVGLGTSDPSTVFHIVDSAATSMILGNDTGGGNLLQLQASGEDKFVIDATGTIVTGGFTAGWIESFTASADQTAITLTAGTYTLGNNELLVFRNGVLQILGADADYVETDTSTITFNDAMQAGERVFVQGKALIASGTVGEISSVAAGTGLTGGGSSGAITLNVGAGDGIVVTADTVAADVGTTANKIVQLDSNAKLPAVDGSQLTNISGQWVDAGAYTYPNNTSDVVISDTGRIGIGLTGPSERLEITLGNMKLTGGNLIVDTVDVPTGLAVSPQGAAGSTTYGYRVAAVNANGDTLACSTATTATGNATLDATNFNRLTWTAVTGATSYKVYGRTNGSELYMATPTSATWDDIGTVTPSGSLPSSDTAAGKVGIGQTDPSYDLDITGDINVTGTFYQDGAIFYPGYWTKSGDIVYYNDGNVGIGTATPSKKLQVVGTGLYTGKLEIGAETAILDTLLAVVKTTEGHFFEVTDNSTNNLVFSRSSDKMLVGPTTSSDMQFRTADTVRMTMLKTGNIGVGTATPSYLVDVNGVLNATGLKIGGVDVSTSSDSFWSSITGGIHYSAGKVGIGTSTPGQELDIDGDARISETIEVLGAGDTYVAHDLYLSNATSSQLTSNKALSIISGAPGTNTDLTLQGRGTGQVYVDDNMEVTGTLTCADISSPTGGSFDLELGSAAGDDFVIDTDKLVVEGDTGNVGIGDASPEGSLEVVGDFMVSAAAGGDGDKFIVDTSGNIGLNNNSPSVRLDVDGSQLIYDTTASTGTSNLNIRAGAGQSTAPTKLFDIYANNGTTPLFHVTDLGDVGIAITNPAAMLNIKSDQAATRDLFLIEDSSGTDLFTADSSGLVDVTGDVKVSNTIEILGAGDTYIAHDLYFSNATSSQITSNKELTVISGAPGTNTDLTLQGRGTGQVYVDDNMEITGVLTFTDIDRPTGGSFDVEIGSASGDDFVIDTDKLVVEGDTGNVGIGDASPEGTLEVVGDFMVSAAAGGDGDKFIVDTSGNIGLNNNSPSVRLDVDGSQLIYDTTASTGTSNLKIRAGAGQSTAPTKLFDIYANDGTTPLLHVTDLGDVGIAITNPAAMLNIKSDQAATRDLFLIEDSSGTDLFTADSSGLVDVTGDVKVSNTVEVKGAGDTYIAHDLYFSNATSSRITSNKELTIISGSPNTNTDLVLEGRGTGRVYVEGDLEVSGQTIFYDDEGNPFNEGSWTRDDNDHIYYTEGNVGVGLTNPAVPFHVSGNARFNDKVEIGGETFLGCSLSIVKGAEGHIFEFTDNTTHNWVVSRSGSDILFGPTTNTGMHFRTNDDVKMVIDPTGKVGIATTAPQTLLDVAGASSGPGLYVTSGGNVGIGNTAPSEPLEVEGVTDLELLEVTAAGDTYIAHDLYLSNATSSQLTSNKELTIISGAPGTNTDLTLQGRGTGQVYVDDNMEITGVLTYTDIVRPTGGSFDVDIGSASGDDFVIDTDKLVVEGDTGNVGIGDASPEGTLEVVGDFMVSAAAGGDGDKFIVDSSGLVGINNNSPSVKLDIDGSQLIYNTTGGTGTTNLKIQAGAGQSTAPTKLFDIYANDGTTPLLHVTDLGDVGIAITNPAAMLNIKSDQAATRDLFLIEDSSGTDLFTADSSGLVDIEGNVEISDTIEIEGAGDTYIAHDLYFSNATSTKITSNKALTIISGAPATNTDLTLQGRGTGKVYVDDNFEVSGTILRTTGDSFDIDIGSAAGDDFIVDTDKLVVEGDTGNVGIGETSPDGTLEIVGDLMVSSAVGGDGDRFIVNTSGNIGLNNNSPSVRLDVDGSQLIYDTTASTGTTNLNIRAGAGQSTAPTKLFDIYANNGTTPLFHVTDLGDVGIAITNPAAMLNIKSDQAATRDLFLIENSSGTDLFTADSSGLVDIEGNVEISDTIEIEGAGDTYIAHDLYFSNATASQITSNKELTVISGAPGTNTHLTLRGRGTGKVYVDDNFEVSGTIVRTTGDSFDIDIGSASGDDFIVDTDKLVVEGDTGNVGIGETSPDGTLEIVGDFMVSATTGGDGDRFIVNTSGDVGINNNSPSVKLDIDGSQFIYNTTGGTGTTNLNIRAGAGQSTAPTKLFDIYANNGTTPLFHVTDLGDVGIAITNPAAMLNIKSDQAVTRDLFLIEDSSGTDLFTADGSGLIDINGNIQISDTIEVQGAGDVYLAHDLYFSNATSSQLTSNKALTIISGAPGTNTDLTLQGRGTGKVYVDDALDVNGTIYQRGGSLHADYVFEPGYGLETIEEHAVYMWKEKHLKAVPKAELDENGKEMLEIGAHRRGMLEELEKAHVYIQELHERVKALEEKITE